jgi:hypothetical protein
MSLRWERSRLPKGVPGERDWRKTLSYYRVDDLWQVPEFRRLARPFARESDGPQPGLVIDFRAYAGDPKYPPDESQFDRRLIGRSVWNTRWLLVIPGASLLGDPDAGLDSFIDGVDDIIVYLQTYAYSGG